MFPTRPHLRTLELTAWRWLPALLMAAALALRPGLSAVHLETCGPVVHAHCHGEDEHGAYVGGANDDDRHHDPFSCRTCAELLVLKLTTTLDLVPTYIPVPAYSGMRDVRSLETPGYAPTSRPLARGPPFSLAS